MTRNGRFEVAHEKYAAFLSRQKLPRAGLWFARLSVPVDKGECRSYRGKRLEDGSLEHGSAERDKSGQHLLSLVGTGVIGVPMQVRVKHFDGLNQPRREWCRARNLEVGTQEARDVVAACRNEAQDFPRIGLHVQFDPDVILAVVDNEVERRQSIDDIGDGGQANDRRFAVTRT